MKNICIETFNDIQDAFLFMEIEMELRFWIKAEILKTPDGRFRVALLKNELEQLEFDLDGG